jgi:hypothetical protein
MEIVKKKGKLNCIIIIHVHFWSPHFIDWGISNAVNVVHYYQKLVLKLLTISDGWTKPMIQGWVSPHLYWAMSTQFYNVCLFNIIIQLCVMEIFASVSLPLWHRLWISYSAMTHVCISSYLHVVAILTDLKLIRDCSLSHVSFSPLSS